MPWQCIDIAGARAAIPNDLPGPPFRRHAGHHAEMDDLRLLPGHVVAPLVRALISIPRRPESRLILTPVTEARPPFYDLRDDYNVMFRDRRVGRVSFTSPIRTRRTCCGAGS